MHDHFWELERYDWNRVRTMTKHDIPLALRRLLFAENESDVNDGYWNLEGCVVVSGSVWEAALPVVRCITTVLYRVHPPNRAAAIELLFQIIRGCNDPQGCGGGDIVAQCVDEVYKTSNILFGIVERPATPEEGAVCVSAIAVLCNIKKDHDLVKKLLWYASRWLETDLPETTRREVQLEIDALEQDFPELVEK